jgi:hypothetical protein
MAPPRFSWDSDAPETRSVETLAPLQKSQILVYPHNRRRKGVDNWTFLLGCVRVGPRNTQNQDLPQLLIRFPLVRPKWEFRAISPETRDGDAGEAGHTPELHL